MMMKKQNYLKHAIVLFLLLLLMQPERAWAAYENVEFSSLTNHDGLTNSQVGAILKDTRGYIWFGTQSGLCRFDGFRMKTFYYIIWRMASGAVRFTILVVTVKSSSSSYIKLIR